MLVDRQYPAQTEGARRLLAHEGAAGSADECAAAAARVYDKIHVHLSPLVGAAGVHLLFIRSAQLAQLKFACLAGVSVARGSQELRDCLQAQDPAIATEAAASLFGTFFGLISIFIGERLTTQALRSAWPTMEEGPVPREPKP